MFSSKHRWIVAWAIAGLGVLAPSGAAHSVSPTAQVSRDQDAHAVAATVAQFLKTQAQSAQRDALHVRVVPPKTKGLRACDTLQVVPSKDLRARTTIQVRCLAPQTWTLYVQTHLSLPGVYYTAARTLVPGESIGPDDLRVAQADLLHVSTDTITDAAQAIGRITTQRIRKGGAIKSGVLRDAQSIQRGQRVYTEARGPGFAMRGVGQALQSGAPGSTIQVRTASGSVVSAMVLDATTVQVPL